MRAGHPAVRPEDRLPLSRPDTPASSSAVTWGGIHPHPAANCGVFGLKPSHGIIRTRGHIPGPPGTLSEPELTTLGPLGRSADDLDLGLDVLAGPDARSARAWRLELPGPRHTTLGGYGLLLFSMTPTAPSTQPWSRC